MTLFLTPHDPVSKLVEISLGQTVLTMFPKIWELNVFYTFYIMLFKFDLVIKFLTEHDPDFNFARDIIGTKNSDQVSCRLGLIGCLVFTIFVLKLNLVFDPTSPRFTLGRDIIRTKI